MKKLILMSTAVLAICFTSCDKVTNPIVNSSTTPAPTTNTNVRKVLIEDYTGQKCGNCPPAAAQAEALINQYPGKVIAIAVHSGDFAKIFPPTFPTSYTTQAGVDWNGASGFNISNGLGNPNGMINRKDYGSGLVKKETAWSTYTGLALSDTYILKLSLTPTYDAATRILNTAIKAKFKTPYASNTVITLVITEDSIIGPQKDYTKNPDVIPNYVFMNMLRGDINGSWGTVLKNAPILANDSISTSFNNFSINSIFNDKQLYLVGFVSDATTREVLQVEKVKIR